MTEAKVREVSPGIFVVHLPLPMRPTIINVTLLHSDGEWALVDTGVNTDDSLAALESALHAVGSGFDQLSKIICTHHHPDHYGASQALRERTRATIYLHDLEYEASQHYGAKPRKDSTIQSFRRNGIPLERFGHVPSPAEFWNKLYRPTQPDRRLDDGDVVTVGKLALRVVTTPGHTPGHCVLYLERERVMIAGDHLLPKITPHVGAFPDGPPNPLADFLASQKKVQRLDVQLVLPAHGGTFTDHVHRSEQIIHHHQHRVHEMLDIVRRAPHTAYEVARLAWGFDVDAPLTMQFPATFETIAHLEYMRSRGLVIREDDVVTRYRAA